MSPLGFRSWPLPMPVRHLAASAAQMAGRLVAMGSIAAFGFAVLVGAMSAIDSVGRGRDAWYADGHLADLELRVGVEDVANFPDFSRVPGVADLRLRLVLPARLELPSGATLPALVVADGAPGATAISRRTIVDGAAPAPRDAEGIVVERSLARFRGVALGDRLTLAIGDEALAFTVRGVAFDPEFLLAPANPLLFVPAKGSLGVVYIDPAVLARRFGFVPANSVLFRLAEPTQPEPARRAIAERAGTRLDVEWTAASDEQFASRFLEKDLQAFRIVVPVIALFCALAASFVTTFLFIQWVTRERQALAVFMALGHEGWRLASAFAAIAALLAGVVVVVGSAVAPLIGRAFLESFAGANGLPVPPLVLARSSVGWAVAGVAAVFAVAGAVAIRRVLVLAPRDAMRHEIALTRTPDRIGGALGRLLPWVWLRLPVRSLFRHRWVSLASIASVAAGIGVAASFQIAYTSFVGTTMSLVAQNSWDCAVDFLAPQWDDDVARIAQRSGVGDYTPYTRGIVQAAGRQGRVNLHAGGFEPGKPWYAVTLVAGQGLSDADPAGMLLEQGAARELGVDVGARLVVEAQGRRRTATVRGVFSGALPGEARFTLAFHRDLADLGDRATGMLVRGPGDAGDLARRLAADRDVERVLTKAQASAAILAVSAQMTEIIHLAQAVSVVIAALSVFASVGYTVLMRRDEYRTLRVLGYGDGLVTVLILVEVALIGVAALCAAVPIGAFAADYYNQRLSQAWFRIDTLVDGADYARVFAPGFGLLLATALPAARMVLAEPLAAGLRSHGIE